MKRRLAILEKFGIAVTQHADILDFGCGAGRAVYSLRDQGYERTVGYDVRDVLELRDPADRAFFSTAEVGATHLPFDDDSFDLIISQEVLEHVMDQVVLLRELHRVMRPGGCAIHVFPARYSLLEPRTFVPLGGVLAHRWQSKLWAYMGIRNEFQLGKSADEVADLNAFFFVEALNYVPNSCYETVWPALGYEYSWLDQATFETSERALFRIVGRLNRLIPIIGWLNRTFLVRRVLLIKRAL